ncbi:MAG: sigma 54-interacting transcriptional regulator [Algicola sp.]|nr:sigma 54-interacting transcriptional regulator [Algicola sp.]
MKHCSITDLSDQPTTANLLANQHLLKSYFDSTGECDQFEHAAVKLYHVDEQMQGALNFDFGRQGALDDGNTTSYPILYQRERIGDLQLAGNTRHEQASAAISAISADQCAINVAKKIALLIKRDQANTLSGLYLGKALSLNGYSESIFNLESFIERAASSHAPVVIEGDFGCEKLVVASSIHYNSPLKHKPFIEINCSVTSAEAFEQKLVNCFVQAKGGSIYLHGVDELSLAQQQILVELLGASSEHSITSCPQINTSDVRLIFSTTQSLATLVMQNSFSRQLNAQLNFLQVKIPALKQRKEDIAAIVQQLVKQHRVYQEQNFSSEVQSALHNYHWPENYQEMERTVARVMALSTANPIDLTELKKYAPDILLTQPLQQTSSSNNKQPNDPPAFDLIQSLMDTDYSAFKHLHAGLQKALQYVGANYAREITLGELAQNAYVSPSHLSYLLKFYLKRSFKQILAELRIEKAKLMFCETPNLRITDVSLDVGFGDLSHFEKIFKRYTKVTPRQYKNQQKLNA